MILIIKIKGYPVLLLHLLLLINYGMNLLLLSVPPSSYVSMSPAFSPSLSLYLSLSLPLCLPFAACLSLCPSPLSLPLCLPFPSCLSLCPSLSLSPSLCFNLSGSLLAVSIFPSLYLSLSQVFLSMPPTLFLFPMLYLKQGILTEGEGLVQLTSSLR